MKKFKSRLIKKEVVKITEMVQELHDYFGDFYLTKNNLRLFIKENISLLFEGLKAGDKICYSKDSIIIVTGFSDKNNRKYIKLLNKNEAAASDLLTMLAWNLKVDLWAKLKVRNPLVEVLKNNNFVYFASRGKEVLLVRKYINKENKC